KDDEGKEQTAITAYNSLMDDGMDALLGTVTSAPCIVIKDYTAQDGILQITPSGSAINCITDADNAFRLCFTDPLQGKTMADFAVNDLGYKNIAVIFNNSDEYSTGMKDAFVEEVEALGGTIVSNQAFNEGDVDFTAQLTAIKNSNAEILFVPTYYEAASYIAQQAKDIGLNLPFIGGDGWDGILKQVTDPSTVEGAIFLSPFLATDPEVADFVASYEAAYNSTPDQFAADGYDVVYVMKAAMEQAGSTESADMIAAMTEIEVDGLTGKVKFSADGEPEKGAKFVTIKDGQYVAYHVGDEAADTAETTEAAE
ncbi:MAG TPA: ABC transporter substrate-binding protein, partial [Candidatus Fimicola cottocaccae]|nr:ABC transporter substrate-binding protein [Candidatus Fimicola cottocaccae]